MEGAKKGHRATSGKQKSVSIGMFACFSFHAISFAKDAKMGSSSHPFTGLAPLDVNFSGYVEKSVS